MHLRHLIEGYGELALFMSGGILVDDTAGGSLVDLLYGSLVGFRSGGLVTGLYSSVELFNCCLELRVCNLILKSLLLYDKYTLLC